MTDDPMNTAKAPEESAPAFQKEDPKEQAGQPAPSEEKKENACRIIVCDAEGNPVAGTMVQFCSDTTCVMGKTDAEGTASFNIEEGQKYTVHVHKAPEGYETDPEEYAVPEKTGDVRITLKKA